MKDTEIHNGLPDKKLRNYISKNYVALTKSCQRTVIDYKYDFEDPYLFTIESLKERLQDVKNDIRRVEKLRKITFLMKSKEWQINDVSYWTKRSSWNWRPFIGTKSEYKEFKKVNKFKD